MSSTSPTIGTRSSPLPDARAKRTHWAERVRSTLIPVGVLVGASAAGGRWCVGAAEFTAGWEWDAFAALSAMAGFTVAAMSLVIATTTTERYSTFTRRPSWNRMLTSMTRSMFAWMLAAVVALVHWLWAAQLVEGAFLFITSIAIGCGFDMMMWVWAVVRGFRNDLNW